MPDTLSSQQQELIILSKTFKKKENSHKETIGGTSISNNKK
jgi:hypothetical protein